MAQDRENDKKGYIATRETAGFLLVVVCLFLFLCCVSRDALFSNVGKGVCTFMYGVFGYGSFPLLALMCYGAIILIWDKCPRASGRWCVAVVFAAVCLFLLFQTVAAQFMDIDLKLPYSGYLRETYTRAGDGISGFSCGGLLSAIIVYPVAKATTYIGAYVIFAVASLALIGVSFIAIRNHIYGNKVAKISNVASEIDEDDDAVFVKRVMPISAVMEEPVSYSNPKSPKVVMNHFVQPLYSPSAECGQNVDILEEGSKGASAGDSFVQMDENVESKIDNSGDIHAKSDLTDSMSVNRRYAEKPNDEILPDEKSTDYSSMSSREILYGDGVYSSNNYRDNYIFNPDSYFNHQSYKPEDYYNGLGAIQKPNRSFSSSEGDYSVPGGYADDGYSPIGFVPGEEPVSSLYYDLANSDSDGYADNSLTGGASQSTSDGSDIESLNDTGIRENSVRKDSPAASREFLSDLVEGDSVQDGSFCRSASDDHQSGTSSIYQEGSDIFRFGEKTPMDGLPLFDFVNDEPTDDSYIDSLGKNVSEIKPDDIREHGSVESDNGGLSSSDDSTFFESFRGRNSSREIKGDSPSRSERENLFDDDNVFDNMMESDSRFSDENSVVRGESGGIRDIFSAENFDNPGKSEFADRSNRANLFDYFDDDDEDGKTPVVDEDHNAKHIGFFDDSLGETAGRRSRGIDGVNKDDANVGRSDADLSSDRDLTYNSTGSGFSVHGTRLTNLGSSGMNSDRSGGLSNSQPEPIQKPKPIHKWKPYKAPSLSLLNDYVETGANTQAEIEHNKIDIVDVLASYNIESHIENVIIGSRITRYDVKLADAKNYGPALKHLSDIQMALRVETMNGYQNFTLSCLSIEVPNRGGGTIGLKALLESPSFQRAKPGSLVFGLGKSLEGKAICPDIIDMPHLLVAGTTGSGKSVCLRALIVSLIYKYGPEDLRFILVDPKQSEFIPYAKLPHLMINEILHDCDKVIKALNWVINEMERRYTLFREKSEKGTITVDIAGYNASLAEGEEKLYRIVVILDEFGDLMLQNKKDIESRIIKLAQKSRACGIHLVLATQRPSVDCITGLIKSNLPTRIGFKVNSFKDSTTIFDVGGAEKLLGKGDMLFKRPDKSGLLRIQGCFVSPEEELQRIIDYVSEKNESYYDEEVSEFINHIDDTNDNAAAGTMSITDRNSSEYNVDPSYLRALKFCITNNSASVNIIQRHLGVNYVKACKMIDWMTSMNYITQPEGSKPRRILITLDEFVDKYGDIEV